MYWGWISAIDWEFMRRERTLSKANNKFDIDFKFLIRMSNLRGAKAGWSEKGKENIASPAI
jgi:hypothetical protein